MKYFTNDIETIEELNEVRIKLMSAMNAEYNELKTSILKNVRAYRRIPLVRLASIPPVEKETLVSFVLTREKTNKASITFNDDGTVEH